MKKIILILCLLPSIAFASDYVGYLPDHNGPPNGGWDFYFNESVSPNNPKIKAIHEVQCYPPLVSYGCFENTLEGRHAALQDAQQKFVDYKGSKKWLNIF